MKRFYYTNISFCFIIVALSLSTLYGQNLLNNPESIVYDQNNNRYIISNWGDGAIIQMDSTGVQSYYNTDVMNQYKVAGLYIYGDTLLAASGDGVDAGITKFDLESGEMLSHIILPDVGLPNDITSDSNGIIYVTDYWDSKLYKIENNTPSVYLSQGLNYPNGIYYDKANHRLLVLSVNGPGTPILGVDLNTGTLSTVVTTGLPGMDGITRDSNNNYYISEWTGDAILKYDNDFTNPPEVFSTGHYDPADIYYNNVLDVLCVPNFSSNSIDFVDLITSVNNITDIDRNIRIDKIYPNPAISVITIEFTTHSKQNICLKVFNTEGHEITTLVNKQFDAGKHSVTWDLKNSFGVKVPQGLYLCNLTANKLNTSKTITVID